MVLSTLLANNVFYHVSAVINQLKKTLNQLISDINYIAGIEIIFISNYEHLKNRTE